MQWDGWKRKDGTNQTWKDHYIAQEEDSLLEDWKRQQKERRKGVAAARQGVHLVHNLLDFHNNDTRRRAEAFKEQLKFAEKSPWTWVDRIPKRGARAAEVTQAEAGPSKRSRRATPSDMHEVVPTIARSASKRTIASASCDTLDDVPLDILSKSSSSSRPMSERARGKQRLIESDVSSYTPPSKKQKVGKCPRILTKAPRSPSPLPPPRLTTLAEKWTVLSGYEITFTNEADYEDGPPLAEEFVYLERNYQM